MDIRQVTDAFSVSPQIEQDDLDAIAEAGFTTIICNRPDGEEPGQTGVEPIKARAQELGLNFIHIPIASGMFGPHHVAQTEEVVRGDHGKILAYCRSGTRSIMLWAFQEVAHTPRDEVLAISAKAGYDLSQQL